MTPGPTARTLNRADEGYEQARADSVWRANLPQRFPEVIVQATSIHDVVAAVRNAAASGQQVSVRSGGHSWSANHVRDGGVLIDVSRLAAFSIDDEAMTAAAEPGLGGSELIGELVKRDLFFPVGHCRGVALGGYLLQGGFGFNSRAVGPACSQVTAVDYVDANGDLQHASESHNSEMLWAARGSGPSFFGVIVRYHLRLHRKPAYIGNTIVQYPLSRLEELVRWIDRVGPTVPPEVELQFVVSRNPSFPPALRRATATSPVRIELVATVMAESKHAAARALEFMATRPSGARVRLPLVRTPMGAMYAGVMQHYPSNTNWETDNLWTHASADDLLPHLVRAVAEMPPPPAHVLWLNWAPSAARADMAFTVEDRTYLSFYGGWSHPADGQTTAAWSRGNVAAMQPLASGVQFADDPGRPSRAVSESARARLEHLRAEHDPDGRFHRWIGDS